MRSSNKVWNLFAEAYSAEAQDFVVHVPKLSLPAFLDWKLNYQDPTQLITAPIMTNTCNILSVPASAPEAPLITPTLAEPSLFSHFLAQCIATCGNVSGQACPTQQRQASNQMHFAPDPRGRHPGASSFRRHQSHRWPKTCHIAVRGFVPQNNFRQR